MEFDDQFAVQAPIDEVWSTVLDLERVAPCVPGAQVLEQRSDDAYLVGITVRVGPISMRYRGDVEILERDPAEHRAVMRATAKETRGQGTADANVELRLAEAPDGTTGTLHTRMQMSGKAAAMGQGVIHDVASRLVATFAENLAAMLEGAEERAPATGAAPGEPAGGQPPPAPAAAGPASDTSVDGAPGAREPREPREPAEPAEGAAVAAALGTTPADRPDAAAAPGRPAVPPADAKPRRAAPGAEWLPLGDVVTGVIADRLKRPRTLLLAAGGIALLGLLIGYRLGRSSS